MDILDGSWPYIQETFVGPFGLLTHLTDDLRRRPYDKHLQMQYATTYMIWIEGVLALSVMKITLNYARDFKVLPAYYTGFTATCRDEARHVQGGMRDVGGWLRVERFMTSGWAAACRQSANSWPEPAYKATKLQDFWDWIAMVRPFITGVVAFTVHEALPDADGDTLALDFAEGVVTGASITTRAEIESGATFLLGGSREDWTDFLSGFDPGKMIMYRKLLLEKGETLQFFMAAFFWTELLAAMQTVPTVVAV